MTDHIFITHHDPSNSSNSLNSNESVEDNEQLDVNNYEKKTEQLTLDMDENELYIYLLEDIYEHLNKNSNLFANTEIIVSDKPLSYFDKSKKTIWTNFRKICKQLKCDENHVGKFFSKEYTTSISINQDGHLLLKGRYTEIIESTLKKYIKTFLQCINCKSINTFIQKKPNKLNYIICNNEQCKASTIIKYSL
jgi:translation initiation factor 2 beta subunit (eIF-2beta)/eIF-5